MGKYDDAIGGVNINLSINEVLDEKSHKKVADKIDETKKNAEEPIKIKVDSGEIDKLLKQEKEIVKTIKQLGHLKINTKGIFGLLGGNMSKTDIQQTINALNNLYEVQNKIRQVSGNTKRTGSDFLSGFSANDIKTSLIPKLQDQLSELNKLGLDNIEQLRERERLQSRLSKITKKDLERAKARVVDGGDAEVEAKAIENVVVNRKQVTEEMKLSGLFSEQEIKDIELQNKGLIEQIKLLRSIRVAKVKDGEKIVVQKDDGKVDPIEEGQVPPARKPRTKKPKVETPAPIESGNSLLQQLKRDAEAASKAFEEAHNKLSDIIRAEQELDNRLKDYNLIDYSQKYQNAIAVKEQEFNTLSHSLAKKSDHKSNLMVVEKVIQNLIENEALSPLGLYSNPQDLSQFVDYKLAVAGGKPNKVLNDLLNVLLNKLEREIYETADTYKSWGNIQSQEHPESDTLFELKKTLAKEHAEATQIYNQAADAKSAAYKRFQDEEAAFEAAKQRVEKDAEGVQKTEQQTKQVQSIVQLVDNYGQTLDEVNNKLMQGTKLLNEQGQILKLFHNSPNVFDKFDTSKSGSRQGATLGKGNYLALRHDSKYSDPIYGRYQTQWYANLEKIFEVGKDTLSPDEINSIMDKFLPDISEVDKKNYLNKFEDQYIAHTVRYIAQKAKVQAADIWSHIGYDAVRSGDEINIFDSSKIYRANDVVRDVGESEADKRKRMQKQTSPSSTSTQQEIKSQEELKKKIEDTNYVIKLQKQWLEYLDPVLDDENFKTSGKRAATEKLKFRTQKLLDYRLHPDQYSGYQNYEEKAEIAQAKAYKEAERQGVAQSTLTRYYTDAVAAHDSNVKKLQEVRALHAKMLEDAEKELGVLQQQLQTEANIVETRKHRFVNTINGKSGKFTIKKPGPQTYETDSGQISMLPALEKEVDDKHKLAEVNEKVAKSQEKIFDAMQGEQLTIDDIIPTNTEDSTSKIEAEAKAFEKAGAAAKEAAESKKKFADENVKVANSTTPAVEGLQAEAGAMGEVDEAAKTLWSTTRPNVKPHSLVKTSEMLDSFNLPSVYTGEKGQDAVQVFAKLKNEIEEMTGRPVTIDFISDVNDKGQLEAVGATLKYVNEEAGITVKQFYDIKRREDEVLVATQSREKATIAATKASKAFNTEMQKNLAEEQIRTLESRMGSLKDSTGDFTKALNDARAAAARIDGEEGLKEFNLSLRVAGEKAKQLKSELKGQNTLDTVASMERALLTLPSRLDEVQRRLNKLGDIEGIESVDDVIRSIQDEYQKFLTTNNAEDKVKLFRSLTSSMVWVNAELNNLSGKSTENKRRETEVEKEELAKQKAARESYLNWWKTTINEQDEVDNYEKSLLEREQKEKAKDERVIAARKKKEEAYEAWWQKALFNQERAPNLNYGKTTANAAGRKRDTIQGDFDALGVTNPELLAKMDTYKAKVKEVLDLRNKFASNPDAAEDTALVRQFQKAASEAERARRGIKTVIDEEQRMIQMSEEQGFSPTDLSADQLTNLKNTMEKLAKSTKDGRVEIKGWNDDNTQMYYSVTNSKGVVEEMTMALGQGTNRLYQYRTATKETGSLIQQVFKGIKVKAKELLSFVIGGGSVYKVIELFRQGIQYIKEIDLALTELKKVTDETEETYDKFLRTAAKTGARLGSTISAVTEATATFAKLGYTMEQATEMAEAAIVYKNVGDNIASTGDAADSIISTMKGFGLEATESMEIVDRFNEVGNRFAITSQGIGEALRLSASALSEGGNSLDESIAMITAANEVVNDPSSVGKKISLPT